MLKTCSDVHGDWQRDRICMNLSKSTVFFWEFPIRHTCQTLWYKGLSGVVSLFLSWNIHKFYQAKLLRLWQNWRLNKAFKTSMAVFPFYKGKALVFLKKSIKINECHLTFFLTNAMKYASLSGRKGWGEKALSFPWHCHFSILLSYLQFPTWNQYYRSLLYFCI